MDLEDSTGLLHRSLLYVIENELYIVENRKPQAIKMISMHLIFATSFAEFFEILNPR